MIQYSFAEPNPLALTKGQLIDAKGAEMGIEPTKTSFGDKPIAYTIPQKINRARNERLFQSIIERHEDPMLDWSAIILKVESEFRVQCGWISRKLLDGRESIYTVGRLARGEKLVPDSYEEIAEAFCHCDGKDIKRILRGGV